MILVASDHDYANLGHNVGKSLRSVGLDCIDVKLFPHDFEYESESKIVTKNTLQTLMDEATLILIMHSSDLIYTLMPKRKDFAVYHTGTRFRKHPHHYLRVFAKAKLHLTDQTEFMRFGKMHYVVSAVDSRLYNPKELSEKLKLCHYPSVAEVKGTIEIIEMLKDYKDAFDIRIDTNPLPHQHSLKRMNQSDIYIELFKPVLWGKPYGCFGVTALEASMMGKIVISQDLEFETYRKTYGEHPFFCAKNQEHFKEILEEILSLTPNQIKDLQLKAHRDTFRNHSHEATGLRLKKLLGIKSMKKVSVIIPYKEDRGWLNDCVESIKNQNYSGEIEIIRMKSDKSVSYNINRGYECATGEYVKFVPEDDMLTPNSIQDSVEAIERGFDFIHGNALNMFNSKDLRRQIPRKATPTLKDMIESNVCHGLTMFYRKSVLDQMVESRGFWFDESLDCAEEYDVNMWLMKNGYKLGYCSSDLGIYRRHDNQKSLGKGIDQKARALKIDAIKNRYR